MLLVPPGVFAPHSDSELLAAAVRREALPSAGRVLDLCTGSGVVALAAAGGGGDVTAVDVSRRALFAAWWNARQAGLRVRVRRGSLFAPVAGERFDLVVSNPPYVPSSADGVPRRGPSRAWAAGHDGRVLLDRICAEVPAHLAPGGAVLLVHSSLVGEDVTLDALRRAGLVAVEVVDRARGPLGPLMREQQLAGLVPAGVEEEDVVVIRAEAPA